MSKENTIYSLTLEGDGVSIKKSIDADTGRRIVNLVLGGFASGVSMPTLSSHNTTPIDSTKSRNESSGSSTKQDKSTPISVREFINSVNATNNAEKIVAFGMFLGEEMGKNTFTYEDVKNCFPKAAEKMPANFGRDFRAAIEKGLICEDHNSTGQYYVTKTGQKAISQNLENGK